METKNGGPAFPATLRGVHNAEHDSWHMVPGSNVLQERTVTGMSLRDYFAAKAMAGALSNQTTVFSGDIDECIRLTCEMSYRIADAMLAAREVQP